jgi:predicted glycosyltransferase
MIIYYAAGGGLGHLTRARAVVHTLGLKDRAAWLTASPFAADKRVVGDTEVIQIPQSFATEPQSYRVWLREIFARYQPAEIYIYSFPAGIVGEFCDFEFAADTRLIHLARLLRWEEYSRQIQGAPPNFALTYRLEPLAAEHEAYLRNHSGEISPLLLKDPPHELDEEMKKAAVTIMRPSVLELLVRHPQAPQQTPAVRRPIWLIVHSGTGAETAELAAYAAEMSRLEASNARLIVITPEANLESLRQTADAGQRTPDSGFQAVVEAFDFYPATAFFPIADRIITACGFNLMRQTENYREKHRFMPFERRFDNQFLRAARRKSPA